MKKRNKKVDTEKDEKVPCPKCLGSGDLAGRRGNHPAMVSPRRCWFCQGAGMVSAARAAQFTPAGNDQENQKSSPVSGGASLYIQIFTY